MCDNEEPLAGCDLTEVASQYESGACCRSDVDFGHGFGCFVPILMMLLFSVLSRNPPLSMGTAIWIGWCIKALPIHRHIFSPPRLIAGPPPLEQEGNAWAGFRGFFDTALSAAIDGYSAIFVFVFLMQMIVGAGHRSGGFQAPPTACPLPLPALADLMAKGIKDSFTCQFFTWLFGFVIFFDDCRDWGPMYTAELKARTEGWDEDKLAAEGAASDAIQPVREKAGIPKGRWWNGLIVPVLFLSTILPFLAYSGADVVARALPDRRRPGTDDAPIHGGDRNNRLHRVGRDWGPMYTAELKARTEGWDEDKLAAEGAASDAIQPVREKAGIPKGRWWNGLIVPVLFLSTILPFLAYSGADVVAWGGIGWDNARGAPLICSQPPPPPAKKMIVWILIFAKAIATISKDLGMPDYLGCALKGTDPAVVPCVTFVLACLCSLGTGTSWGTMAVMFPISLPLAINLCRDEGIEDGSDEGLNILYTTSAAVLGGSACQCSVYDHFKTQIPYAMFCGLSALLLGFLPTAYGIIEHETSVLVPTRPERGAVPTYSPTRGEIGTGIWGIKASVMSYGKKAPGTKTEAA
ncbi:hypothetical protein EMIHUDRAFT_119374 [Emiliania huxleyi CCMP1516]|uniref:Na+/H+ antiporter NhaC-like C-terminal domain-containing protein n=2 Tax=Emiliania huxleyi TaxID=2903 RepID=A0A0D3IW23_EMIH1|nr:hypothetical protein EMIHUDRAFT_119374 [Emiliania huxleyi CCMP1516]EOD15458.1 hypothetical protein EMIHUDRAFT_119374 [Emiliania huxleyi CCMP1516]|eukprot:XP_005767887.1 hypothetical protein EMIHUDRAFT_119374 [Emiliania huxleyi CCMP1516]